MISLKPSEFSGGGGGGLLPDGKYKITEPKFVSTDFDGKAKEELVYLSINFEFMEGEREGESQEMTYMVGKPTDFQPNDDGTGLEPVEGAAHTAIWDKSGFAKFLASMVEHGFDEDKLDNDISVLDGYVVTIKQVPELSKDGKPVMRKSKKDDKEYPVTIGLVESIEEEPGSKKGAKKNAARTAAKPAASKSTKKEAEESGDVLGDAIVAAMKKMPKGGLIAPQFRVNLFQALTAAKVTGDERQGYVDTVVGNGTEDTLNEYLEPLGYKVDGKKIVAA